jgi:hypothetical protein
MKKFIIRYSKKFTGTKKIPSVPINKLTTGDKFRYDVKAKSIFVRRPDVGSPFKQEAAAKFARGVEASKLESGLKKVRQTAIKQFKGTKFYKTKFGTNFKVQTPEGKQALARITKAKTQAVKTARAAGLRALQKRSEEFGVGIKRYGSQKSKFVQKLSDAEARELGFPPREVFKSSKKTTMTDIDKSFDQYSRAEKFNPKTKRFETFRIYDVKTKSGRMGRPLSYFEQKRRK